MPRSGDIIIAYCQHCDRRTEQVYTERAFLPGYWKCLGHKNKS